jgi:soluble lytic murein transglycosylase
LLNKLYTVALAFVTFAVTSASVQAPAVAAATAAATAGATTAPAKTATAAAAATATRAPTKAARPQATRPQAAATPRPAGAASTAAQSTDPKKVQDLMVSGRWHQTIGDCAWARREFAEVIAGQPSPAVASEALYRMAECYLRDQAWAEAADALNQLLADAPKNDPYRGPANFLLGQAQSALGQYKQAEASYTAFLAAVPVLDYMAQQHIGLMRKAQGNLAGAAQAYQAALPKSPDWTNTQSIRRSLADIALEQNNPAAAVSQYDALRGDKTTGALAAEMQYLAGNALALSSAITTTAPVSGTATPVPVPAAATARWQAAADADITTKWAHAAIVSLLDAGVLVDEFQRGLANYYNGVYDLAIAAFDRVVAADPTGKGGLAWYYSGLSRIAAGDTPGGIADLETFIDRGQSLPQWGDAWLAKARAQARGGDTAGAIGTYRKLVEAKPDAPQAAKALWQVAILQDIEPPVAGAAEAYLSMARRYPKADDAWRAYQNAGLVYYRLGNYKAAADTWREMAEKVELPVFTRPVAYYWLGRALQSTGDRAGAEQAWKSAVSSGEDSFYGMRAAEWLEGSQEEGMTGRAVKGAAQSPQVKPAPGSQDEAAQIAAWLKTWAGSGSLSLPQSIRDDADWRRGQALLTLGLRVPALQNFERVRSRYADEPWESAALALAFRDAGANRSSLLAAEQVVALSGKPMEQAPVALQRLAYPMPYSDLIRAEAAKYKLDPRLLAAIIRQESRFEAGVASVAGAQGLMQVMPGTAQGIAAQMRWPDFEPRQAYWPYVNVAFGAYYINQWITNFHDSLFAGLAAYNGGPGNAQTWREWVPEDDDLFTAAININETRTYVQLVWSHYDAYRRLYPQ